jgi:hypothetical protein
VSNLLLLLTALTWIFAAMGLAWLYRQQATWLKFVLALLFFGIGGASSIASFLHWQMELERESARHLVGVAQLRFKDQLVFLHNYLEIELDQDDPGDQKAADSLDWSGTFQMKHREIQLDLGNIIQNAFLQRFHSVGVADAAVYQQQLNDMATSMQKLTELEPKRVTFDSYVDRVIAARKSLIKLEARIGAGGLRL